MKDSFYFSHDYNSRTDSKIKKLLARHGMAGYGVFWSLVEDLYNNANALQMDTESIAYDLRVGENIVQSVILDFDLFVITDKVISSKSVQQRLDKRNEKSIKASESARKRWENSEGNTDAMRTYTEGNANKGKESKVKEIKVKEENSNEVKLPFSSQQFLDAWEDWKQHRIETKTPLTKMSVNKQLKLLAGHSEQEAISIIEKSITGGWTGLFKLNDRDKEIIKSVNNPQQNGHNPLYHPNSPMQGKKIIL